MTKEYAIQDRMVMSFNEKEIYNLTRKRWTTSQQIG